MRTVEFHRFLNDDNALRVRFELEHGQILKFVVQLECRFGSHQNWVPVVRYDTAHGFAHCDRLHPYQPTVKTEMLTQNYNDALTVAMNDLIIHWQSYHKRYEKWLTST